jgi:plastocyanin
MRKPIVLLIGAMILSATIGMGMAVANSRQGGFEVVTQGTESFEANVLIQSTFHFSPGRITVPTGSDITFASKDQSGEPHTVTIVTYDALPKTVEEVFNCGAPGTLCAKILAEHFGQNPPIRFIDADGDGGLNAAGDSLLIIPGKPLTAPVTAPAGTTLYYMCTVHAWMQGSIVVTS